MTVLTPQAAALGLAAEGYSVFPCVYQTKEPAVRRGFYSATTNPATICRWFDRPAKLVLPDLRRIQYPHHKYCRLERHQFQGRNGT
jgi:hypothetical protein